MRDEKWDMGNDKLQTIDDREQGTKDSYDTW